MKKYKIKKSKELIKKLNPYWIKFQKIEKKYYIAIYKLEEEMSKDLKIKDMEIFFCDNGAVGVGNVNRTMELIRREDFKVI